MVNKIEAKNLILFQNTHAVMLAEKICVQLLIPYQVIPVPTHISSECGMCLQIDTKSIKMLTEKVSEIGISYSLYSQR